MIACGGVTEDVGLGVESENGFEWQKEGEGKASSSGICILVRSIKTLESVCNSR